MPFWSSQRLEKEQLKNPIISPFCATRINQGAYEMSLSTDVLVSPEKDSAFQQLVNLLRPSFAPPKEDNQQKLSPGSILIIPPGQFVLAYTEERVKIPSDVISFISIKAKVKLKGLVNISGFHVDPGYEGRLKFSLYNAGNRPICLVQGEPYFLIWFASLDAATRDPYNNAHHHRNQNGVTAEDREQMAEPSNSTFAMDQRVKTLEQRLNIFMAFTSAVMLAIFIPILIGIINIIMQRWFDNSVKQQPSVLTQVHSNSVFYPKH